jgi:hypothetical protein
MYSHYAQSETHHADMSLSVHERIADLHKRAAGLAPAIAESATESGCTDGPGTYQAEHDALTPRRRKAWDMIAEAHGWNAISDRPDMLALAEQYEADGVRYRVGSQEYRDYTIPALVRDSGVFGFGVWVTDPADMPVIRGAEAAVAEAEQHLTAMTEADNAAYAGTCYSADDTLDDTAEQCDSETPSHACVLSAGHSGDHADGPATWPQDSTSATPCTSEDPAHPGLTCHLAASHEGTHYAMGYRWPQDKPPARAESPRCAVCHRAGHFPGTWQGHPYTRYSEAEISAAAQREARVTTMGGRTGTLTGYKDQKGNPYVAFDGGSEYAIRPDAIHKIHPAPRMLAHEVSSPAELAARFGDVEVHWAHGVSRLQSLARAGVRGRERHGWAGYLEMARIRELTAGEAYAAPACGMYRRAFYRLHSAGSRWYRYPDGSWSAEHSDWPVHTVDERAWSLLDEHIRTGRLVPATD